MNTHDCARDEHAHPSHPSPASQNAMLLPAHAHPHAHPAEPSGRTETAGRMDNGYVSSAQRDTAQRDMPAPTARHAPSGVGDGAGEGQGLAVPRRFSDYSKTPDLFRQSP